MRIKDNILDNIRALESRVGDFVMGVETGHSGSSVTDEALPGDSHQFQTNSHFVIRRVIRSVRPEPSDTVVVLGCAKGRALCHFARVPVRKVVGIEISAQLAEVAKQNAGRLHKRKSPIEVRITDAAAADLSEASLIYMFNPFGENTLRRVLTKVASSHRETKKSLKIVYLNPMFSNVFLDFPFFKLTREIFSWTGLRINIYEAKNS